MREAIFAIVLGLAAMVCASHAQQPVYQIQYRPVAVPGDYYAVPRTLPCLQWALGPRVVWIPRPQVPYANPPVQPQPAPVQ